MAKKWKNVRIEGLDDLQKAFERLKGDTQRVMEPADQAGADVVRREANNRAPGPHVEMNVLTVTPTRVEIEIAPDIEHWYYQFFELGAAPHKIKPKKRKAMKLPGDPPAFIRRAAHPGMAAVPFLRPALDRTGPILDAIAAKLREVIK